MRLQATRFHFVGIGGIGMCGLAELLFNMGAKVAGSDVSENLNTERLKQLGVTVFKGHAAANVGAADVVVYSSAINFTNPEIAQARAKQIPLIPRAEALAEIMRLKRGIAIAGTHGKTTTTSMVASIFLEAEVSPTIVVGGRFDRINSTALLGEGEWLIAEADESDGSFSKLSPEIAIVTNIDSDHMDYYKSFENLQKAFHDFSLRLPFYGRLIVCGDDPHIRKVFDHYPKRISYYGFNPGNDIRIAGEGGIYDFYIDEAKVGKFEVQVPGRHNALNAAAALAAGLAAGIDFQTAARGLAKFEGVDRRFHFKGEARGVKIYDDYGHHPTEVRAVLQGFKEKFPTNRVMVMFQPHRYSRTEHCWQEFITCFGLAEDVLITDIYPAGETPIPGISSDRLVKEIKHQNAKYFVRDEAGKNQILSSLQPGDIFLTLGAGDGWKFGLEIFEALKKMNKK
jgi:UDP-N-acetylmuramate--alanine ligase